MHSNSERSFAVAVFVGATLIALIAQYLSGSYEADFGSYADEGAHYVTTLAIIDWIFSKQVFNPLDFMVDYYARMPAVAIGHWPPVYYVLGAAWGIVSNSSSRGSMLLLNAIIAGGLGCTTFLYTRRNVSRVLAVCACAALMLSPTVLWLITWIGSDILLSLIVLCATAQWGAYLERGRPKNALMFGVLSAIAILTKGNGWLLGIMAVIALLVSGKMELVKRPTTWVAAFTALLIALPWQLLTLPITQGAWSGAVGFDFFVGAVPMHLAGLGYNLVVPLLLLIWCLVASAGKGIIGQKHNLTPWISLTVASLLFHSIVPAVTDQRVLVNAYAPFCIIAFSVWSEVRTSSRKTTWTTNAIPAVSLVVLCFISFYSVNASRYEPQGYAQSAKLVLSHDSTAVVMVSSGAEVDVSMVAAFASSARETGHPIVLRASKLLATSDWNGVGYSSLVRNESGIQAFFDSTAVNWIVVDTVSTKISAHHNDILSKYAHGAPEWELFYATHRVLVYKRTVPAINPRPLTFSAGGRRITVPSN